MFLKIRKFWKLMKSWCAGYTASYNPPPPHLLSNADGITRVPYVINKVHNHIVATELKDPIWHSLEWQIRSFSSEATTWWQLVCKSWNTSALTCTTWLTRAQTGCRVHATTAELGNLHGMPTEEIPHYKIIPWSVYDRAITSFRVDEWKLALVVEPPPPLSKHDLGELCEFDT